MVFWKISPHTWSFLSSNKVEDNAEFSLNRKTYIFFHRNLKTNQPGRPGLSLTTANDLDRGTMHCR